MKLYDAFQYAVLAAVVPASLLYVWRSQAPASFRRGRVALALWLLRSQRPAWLKQCGRWVAPAAMGTAGACGGCNGCEPK